VVRRLQGCDHEDQAWFWTDTWQAGERDASEDIRLGRTTTVETLDDMFQELDN
jgi:antitoxin PrlF